MTWPKSFHTFGVGLRTAATEWKLRQNRTAGSQQDCAFRALMRTLARTSFWRDAGVEAGLSYPEFQSRIPPRTAEQLAPAVARMVAGERDVLWPGVCALFAQTAGTTRTTPACVPVTEELLAHVRRATLEVGLYYNVRAKNAGVFRGRHLWLGGSTALKPIPGGSATRAWVTEATGVAAAALPEWAERHYYEPGSALADLDDWTSKLDRVAAHARQRDISLLAMAPPSAVALARVLREQAAPDGRSVQTLRDVWPNLEALVHTGMAIAPFYDELRELLGPSVRFHELYAATEAFVATQDGEPAAGLRLMADLGVFFEFLPLADYDAHRLDSLGGKLVPLARVNCGVDYAIFVTTPAGLVRYPLDDVVRFISTTPPRLIHAGRTSLRLDNFGENVSEKDATDALVAVCRRSRWTVVNFHVAPLPTANLTGANRGRHEWWVELNAGTFATPRGPQLAGELDAELRRVHPGYAHQRATGALEPPFVRLVMPGVFKHWLQYNARWGGQDRTPRCRNDRLVADELAEITHFARD